MICSNPPTGYELTLDQAKKEADWLIEKRCTGVILSGGEPTLYPHLPELIRYCKACGLFPRIITNGQKTCDEQYLSLLKESGLQHLHLSIYSCRPEVQAKLTGNAQAFANIEKSLTNIVRLGGMTVDVNIVINKYNAGHLLETVSWIVEHYGFVPHCVFNNLDPCMNRVAEHPDVVPRLNDFELELHRALQFLAAHGKTFRVERVPLCYLTDFEHVSTETRKIVLNEQRTIYFLDDRGEVEQEDWYYKKGDACRTCRLNKICAGLYALGQGYDEGELYPVFIDPAGIIEKIKGAS